MVRVISNLKLTMQSKDYQFAVLHNKTKMYYDAKSQVIEVVISEATWIGLNLSRMSIILI